jgi:signal transduction histidine kinase/ActR/RegA family two-component response regulator
MMSSKPIDPYQEWSDLRASALTFFSLLYLFCSILLIGYSFISSLSNNTIPWLILFVSSLVIFRVRESYPHLAAGYVIGTGWMIVVVQQLFVAYNENFMYFSLFPVFIAFLFVKHIHIPKISATTIILVLLIDSFTHQILWVSQTTLIIGILAITAGMCGYILIENAQSMVQWAVDSQSKNFIRAESFFEQGERLRGLVNDLQHANDQLQKLTGELNDAKQKVEEVSQAKSVFLSNMSHELRTPLNMVIGYTSSILNMPQMYNHQTIADVFRPDIELIQSSGHYLLALINDILDLSKIESGKFEINPTTFDLNQVLQGVMATSVGLVKDKPLQLKPDYPDKLPLIWADPMRVRQILLNLMSNAIKYTLTGSVTLSAKLRDNKIEIAVSDTGMGIPKNILTTIFDRFEQVQNNANIQGTGLGLDISQRLAHMHASTITVESTVDVGSTFAFDLPIATPEQLIAFAGDTAPSGLTGIKRFTTQVEEWQTRHTVLIAEDDSVTRGLLIRIFEAHNYIVFDVQDGNAVFETVDAILPDLVILDIVLPNKDGWVILDEIRQTPETSEIPVVVLTANLNAHHPSNKKANVCLEKPVNGQTIIQLAEQLIIQRMDSKTGA